MAESKVSEILSCQIIGRSLAEFVFFVAGAAFGENLGDSRRR